MLALIPLVFAAPESSRPILGFSLGAEAVTNDPFLVRDAVRLGATLRVSRWIEVGVGAGWFPVFTGDAQECPPDWTEQACAITATYDATPDVSRIVGEADTVVRVRAAELPLDEHWRAVVGVEAGLGAVLTEDDGAAIGPDAYNTAVQVHAATRASLFGEAGTRRVSVRVHWGPVTYIETVAGITLEMKNNLLLGADVILWFP